MKFELRSLIAQRLLTQGGYYSGVLDGLWGPLSRDAAAVWRKDELMGKMPEGSSPYELALKHLGEKEIPGSRHNSKIVRWHRIIASWIYDDETPWCSSFVNAMALEAGMEHTDKINARSWLKVGEHIDEADAKQGDVAIFWRVSPNSWQGHVGFIHEYKKGDRFVRLLGGNQSNSVSIANYTASSLLGIRRLRPLDEI